MYNARAIGIHFSLTCPRYGDRISETSLLQAQDKERRTLTEETRAATEADKVLPLAGLSKFLLTGAENAATRAAEGADERPALAATRAEALVIEAATIVTLEFACVSSV